MPERRKRMMEVAEAPVVSIPLSPAPVAQISLVPRNEEFREPAAAPVLAPKPLRFLSQDEEDEKVTVKADDSETWDKTGFFTPVAPSEPTANSAAVAEPPEEAAFEPEEMEPESAPAPPRFAELAEEPTYDPLLRDYAPEFTSGVQNQAEIDDNSARRPTTLFPDVGEESQPDLEKPTFLRNLQL
jgi:hypothetical protein